jgi:hypothetical protein
LTSAIDSDSLNKNITFSSTFSYKASLTDPSSSNDRAVNASSSPTVALAETAASETTSLTIDSPSSSCGDIATVDTRIRLASCSASSEEMNGGRRSWSQVVIEGTS